MKKYKKRLLHIFHILLGFLLMTHLGTCENAFFESTPLAITEIKPLSDTVGLSSEIIVFGSGFSSDSNSMRVQFNDVSIKTYDNTKTVFKFRFPKDMKPFEGQTRVINYSSGREAVSASKFRFYDAPKNIISSFTPEKLTILPAMNSSVNIMVKGEFYGNTIDYEVRLQENFGEKRVVYAASPHDRSKNEINFEVKHSVFKNPNPTTGDYYYIVVVNKRYNSVLFSSKLLHVTL